MASKVQELEEQGERIRQLRALSGHSQEHVAHQVGVSVRAYREWEKGNGDLTRENLNRVAEYFGTSTNYIRYGRHQRDSTPELSEALSAGMRDQLERIETMLLELRQVGAELLANQRKWLDLVGEHPDGLTGETLAHQILDLMRVELIARENQAPSQDEAKTPSRSRPAGRRRPAA